MRRDGAVQALLGQDLLRGLVVGDGLEGGVSGYRTCVRLTGTRAARADAIRTFAEPSRRTKEAEECARRGAKAGEPPLLLR